MLVPQNYDANCAVSLWGYRQDTAKSRRGGAKNVNENNIFIDRVSIVNQNIDQMANQLSSIGKDIENRVSSLSTSIQVNYQTVPYMSCGVASEGKFVNVTFISHVQAAEKLWSANPMRVEIASSSTTLRYESFSP